MGPCNARQGIWETGLELNVAMQGYLLRDTAHMEGSRQVILDGRKYLYGQFDELELKYNVTQVNFIWVDFGYDAKEINDFLLNEGVIVRPGWIFGAPTCARVSIGSQHENEFFIDKLKKAFAAGFGKSKEFTI